MKNTQDIWAISSSLTNSTFAFVTPHSEGQGFDLFVAASDQGKVNLTVCKQMMVEPINGDRYDIHRVHGGGSFAMIDGFGATANIMFNRHFELPGHNHFHVVEGLGETVPAITRYKAQPAEDIYARIDQIRLELDKTLQPRENVDLERAFLEHRFYQHHHYLARLLKYVGVDYQEKLNFDGTLNSLERIVTLASANRDGPGEPYWNGVVDKDFNLVIREDD